MAMLSLVCCKPELDFVDGSLRAGRADHFYNFIRLTPGDYTLRLRNPLTGAKLEISVKI